MSVGQVTDDGAMLQKSNVNMTIKNMKPLDNTNDTRYCVVKK